MTSTPAPRQDHRAGRIAAWSAAGGLLTALMVGAISGNLVLDQRAGDATALGAAGFSVALAAPFLSSLGSFLVHSTEMRRAIWLASGVIALPLAGLTIFSGVGWLFGAAAVGLLSAWWMERGHSGWLGAGRSIVLTGWLILWLSGALAALVLRQTPACWSDSGGWITATSPNECTSDITDDTEGLLALLGIAIGLAGMALIVQGGSAGAERLPSSRVVHRLPLD